MCSRIREWLIEVDRDGLFIVDEYGEEAEPTRRYLEIETAEERLREIAREELDNYDGPPDGEAWSGGFAENH